MAQVPYQPFPEEEGTGGGIPGQGINVIPGAFGEGIAQAAGKMGQTLENVGAKQFQTALEFQQLQNETAVNDALQKASDFTIAKEGEFRQLEGQNAVDAFPQFQKDLQEHREQLAASLQSPAAKVAFQREAQSFYQRSLYSAVLHTGDQAKISNDRSWQGAIESDIAQGALHPEDPGSFNESLHSVTQKSLDYAHIKGLDEAGAIYTQQKNVGELVRRSVDTLLSKNDIDGANRLFAEMQQQTLPDSGKPALDPLSIDAIGKALRTNGARIYGEQDKAATQTIIARTGLAVTNGEMPLDDAIGQLSDSVNAGSDKLNITDPNQRAERISDAASRLGISVIEAVGAKGTSLEDDRAALAKQQELYKQLQGMKLPGYPDQPLLNSTAQDSIAIRLHTEAETIERRTEAENDKMAAQLRVPLVKS